MWLAWAMVILGGLGLYGLAYTRLSAYIKSKKALSWPSVDGVITQFEVVEREREDNDGVRYVEYDANISYEYEVNGISYISHQIAFNELEFSERVVSKYRSGTHVKVYYSVNDPQQSVLEADFKWEWWDIPVILICLSGIAGGIFFISCKY